MDTKLLPADMSNASVVMQTWNIDPELAYIKGKKQSQAK